MSSGTPGGASSGAAGRGPGGRPVLSFEFFPPRSAAGVARVREAAGVVARARPGFVSVTYGTGEATTGGDGAPGHRASHELTRYLAQDLGLPVVAHLTPRGLTRAELDAEIVAFLADGATGFLAMGGAPRGDPGTGSSPAPVRAEQLVARLRSGPAARARIAVTAFPTDRPGLDRSQELATLAAKVRAGADLAVTQVFFRGADYAGLVRDARAAGIGVPVVPGIMPVTSSRRLERAAAMAGTEAPAWLSEELGAAESRGDGAGAREIGVRAAAELGTAALAAGAPGLHVFTMNDATTTRELVRALER